MLFNKNNIKPNDRIIYQTKPNMLLGCKKAIYGIILLIIILMVSPILIKFIGEMQVYLISYIKLSLTRYIAIAFFVVIFIDILYIIWQLIGWYSTEYYLTDSKIIIKSGVLSNKKNYMPYTTIQDVNTSQSILARLFNVGSISIYSAYDNNQMELKNIYNPSDVEDIIFSKINDLRNFQYQPQGVPYNSESHYIQNNDYYDEFEPITPINREVRNQPRHYDYYPEEDYVEKNSPHNYEYEPYNNQYMNSSDNYTQDNYYNQLRDEYSYVDDEYYQDDGSEIYYNDGVDEFTHDEQDELNSSQDVIRRHFDKFKK